METSSYLLLALAIVLAVPWLIWRLARTERHAPLVVVQILAGIVLGPGIAGAMLPEWHAQVFSEAVIVSLDGIAIWGVVLFVWLAGLELDLGATWKHRGDALTTAALALATPLIAGALVAWFMHVHDPAWKGAEGASWQFVLGIGMACAVTALPILILFMDRLDMLRRPLGQRVLRYASLDDIAIWVVLTLILLDFERMGQQALFVTAFVTGALLIRRLIPRLDPSDRWFTAIIWLTLSALASDIAGLHYMVGAFLAGVVLDSRWFGHESMDRLRDFLLLVMMPVFFLSTGLKTEWTMGGATVLMAAALLAAAVWGKLAGVSLAGWWLDWKPGEARLIGWLLQTKALIMIIFANILLDRAVISAEAFTALLLMAAASTMMTIPMVNGRHRELINASCPGVTPDRTSRPD
jgi:Kef-type K+ transport system membrane component KefB